MDLCLNLQYSATRNIPSFYQTSRNGNAFRTVAFSDNDQPMAFNDQIGPNDQLHIDQLHNEHTHNDQFQKEQAEEHGAPNSKLISDIPEPTEQIETTPNPETKPKSL